MNNKSKTTANTLNPTNSTLIPTEAESFEGERLARLLKYLRREIVKLLDGNSLPEKFWYKQQFAIGVNEVTRVLERMPPAGASDKGCSTQQRNVAATSRKVPLVQLQAILVASDCNPKWLIKHLPGLAFSRNVPFIFVKDNKGGSLRLGELVNLKTAMAIGVKAKGNGINQIVEEILRGNEIRQEEEEEKQGQ